MDIYGFYTGKTMDAYKYLGCQVMESGATFRTFAPAAIRVTLVGEFNEWQERDMAKVLDGNFWECHIDNAREGMMYKYRIYTKAGYYTEHCDPYGFGMELRPGAASIIRDIKKYKFHDKRWLNKRSDCKDKPLNIYEVHLGSWKMQMIL